MADYRELKERVRIIDIARGMGFHPYPVGRYYSLREHDSVRIDSIKNIFYRNSTGEHGSVIDFVMAFGNKSFSEAVEEIRRHAGLNGPSRAAPASHTVDGGRTEKKRAVLCLPEKGGTYRNVLAYLIKTRGIDGSIVKDMVARHRLYQDRMRNCVFVSYDESGQAVFACKRGTSTKHRYVADVLGSDYTYGCYFDSGSDTLLVCESVIDIMSYMTLKHESRGDDSLALAGTGKIASVFYHAEKKRYRKIILALDNDDAGRIATEAIFQRLQEMDLIDECEIVVDVPERKDWNDMLVKGVT